MCRVSCREGGLETGRKHREKTTTEVVEGRLTDTQLRLSCTGRSYMRACAERWMLQVVNLPSQPKQLLYGKSQSPVWLSSSFNLASTSCWTIGCWTGAKLASCV
jgi:hypothetical protein